MDEKILWDASVQKKNRQAWNCPKCVILMSIVVMKPKQINSFISQRWFYTDDHCTFTISPSSSPSPVRVAPDLTPTLSLFLADCPPPDTHASLYGPVAHHRSHIPPVSSLHSFTAVFVCRTSLWLPGGLSPPSRLLLQLLQFLAANRDRKREKHGENLESLIRRMWSIGESTFKIGSLVY